MNWEKLVRKRGKNNGLKKWEKLREYGEKELGKIIKWEKIGKKSKRKIMKQEKIRINRKNNDLREIGKER